MEEAEARAADCGVRPSEETHSSVSIRSIVYRTEMLTIIMVQCEEDGGDVSLAPRCGRVSPHQEVGAPPGVDCQVHGGVLQAGGQGEGDGSGHLSSL